MGAWVYWLGLTLLLFFAYEGFALYTKRIPTLSQMAYTLGKSNPLVPFLIGFAVASLVWHFWGDGWCI